MPKISARWAAPLFPLFVAAHAVAQVLVCVSAFAQSPDASKDGPVEDTAVSSPVVESTFRPGFEAGARLGAALPMGKAGRDVDGADRKLSDLTSWRTPLWLDVAYRVSPSASLGLYGQLGFGGTGDGCVGKCDFSDLRIGVQGQWRFSPHGKIDPWLGLGAGWESLSYRTLSADTGAQATELLGGPEVLLQGGLGLQLERSLEIGPFVSLGVGNYLRDSYKCFPEGIECPTGSSVAGSGFHTWLGFGLSARYSP